MGPDLTVEEVSASSGVFMFLNKLVDDVGNMLTKRAGHHLVQALGSCKTQGGGVSNNSVERSNIEGGSIAVGESLMLIVLFLLQLCSGRMLGYR